MQTHLQARLALVALLSGATGIALAPLWVRWSEVGPSATAFYRLLFALPVLWLWRGAETAREPRTPGPASARDYWLLGLAGFCFAGDLAVWHWSIKLTSVANATLFVNFAPILVTLGARALFGERIVPRFVAGLALALGGGALVAGVSLTQTMRQVQGDALGLATAFFYAGYLLSLKLLRHSFSTSTIMAWTGLTTCPLLLAVALASGEGLRAATSGGWCVLVALALSSHVGGQGLIAYAAAHMPASFLSVALLFQPVVAAILAWLLLREPMKPLQIVGGLTVLAGIGLAKWGTDAAPPRAQDLEREPRS